jgi:hypothetical protein
MDNTNQEQKDSKKASTIRGILTRIKRHLYVSWSYLKFILTVQHKDGTSLGTDLIAIACVVLSLLMLFPNTPFFVSLVSEVGLLVVTLAVLEPLSALFERQGE